jgi:hypothetical protein
MMQRAWLVFGLTACCAWGAESPPHDGSSQVILHCDFDTDAWLQPWGLAKAPERAQLVDATMSKRSMLPIAVLVVLIGFLARSWVLNFIPTVNTMQRFTPPDEKQRRSAIGPTTGLPKMLPAQ